MKRGRRKKLVIEWHGPGPTRREVLAVMKAAHARGLRRVVACRSSIYGRRKNPSAESDAYKRFHWGETPRRERAMKLPDFGRLYELGKLVRVEYLASKDGEECIWVHDFEEPLPSLTATARGRLGPIVGGRARVTPRGIER